MRWDSIGFHWWIWTARGPFLLHSGHSAKPAVQIYQDMPVLLFNNIFCHFHIILISEFIGWILRNFCIIIKLPEA